MQTFLDDDRGYLAWLAGHPDGYVVNADRPPNSSYLRLHRATCRTISAQPATGSAWTVTSTKICGERQELADWARREVSSVLSPCATCM